MPTSKAEMKRNVNCKLTTLATNFRRTAWAAVSIAGTFISLIALTLTVGCATNSPPLVVAYGRFVSQHDDIDLRVARYEVSEIQRGHLPTNVVEVVFWRKTQTRELPREAVLLLSRPLALSPPIWHAVGEDASRGILPDTSDVRSGDRKSTRLNSSHV